MLAKKKNNKIIKIRLTGIDCFETSKINRAYKQAYLNNLTIEEVVEKGQKSKIILEKYINNSDDNFYYIPEGIDKYKRELGTLYSKDENINDYMLKCGGCLKYTYKN